MDSFHEEEETEEPKSLEFEDRLLICRVFREQIEEKLKRLHARTGTLCCSFAGDRYRNWLLRFASRGSGFEITDFQFDTRAADFSLDL